MVELAIEIEDEVRNEAVDENMAVSSDICGSTSARGSVVVVAV